MRFVNIFSKFNSTSPVHVGTPFFVKLHQRQSVVPFIYLSVGSIFSNTISFLHSTTNSTLGVYTFKQMSSQSQCEYLSQSIKLKSSQPILGKPCSWDQNFVWFTCTFLWTGDLSILGDNFKGHCNVCFFYFYPLCHHQHSRNFRCNNIYHMLYIFSQLNFESCIQYS